jgi:hypothetical protein
LSPWWRRRQVPPKRRFLQEPHGVTTQKTPFFNNTPAVLHKCDTDITLMEEHQFRCELSYSHSNGYEGQYLMWCYPIQYATILPQFRYDALPLVLAAYLFCLFFDLEMNALHSSNTSVNFHQVVWCRVSEDTLHRLLNRAVRAISAPNRGELTG